MASSSRQQRAVRSSADYYAVLGARSDATFQEIEAAYWRLASERRDQIPILNEAYEVLSNAERRLAYDAQRQQAAAEPDAPEPGAPSARSPGVREKLNWYLR